MLVSSDIIKQPGNPNVMEFHLFASNLELQGYKNFPDNPEYKPSFIFRARKEEGVWYWRIFNGSNMNLISTSSEYFNDWPECIIDAVTKFQISFNTNLTSVLMEARGALAPTPEKTY